VEFVKQAQTLIKITESKLGLDLPVYRQAYTTLIASVTRSHCAQAHSESALTATPNSFPENGSREVQFEMLRRSSIANLIAHFVVNV
jgi:hypothetical protein